MEENPRVRLTSLALALSLGLMTTITSCEINPDGGGEGGEGGDGGEQGKVMEYSVELANEGGEYENN